MHQEKRRHAARRRCLVASQVAKLFEQCRRGVAEGFGDLTELDHVNPPLAPLYLRYEALGPVQAGGKLDLSDAGSLTCRDKELKKFLMPLREDRGWQ